jgi:cell wall-associated NlpC family hydrolase
MIYSYELHGMYLQTGDIICSSDGAERMLFNQAYRALGMLVPGPVDHVAVYVGPGPRCVESGPFGVISFDIHDQGWEADLMWSQRKIADTFYGVAYPLAGRGLSAEEETRIRLEAAAYCLRQAEARKPYNFNFFNSETEEAFYCSQLIYKAYQQHGIDLNTNQGVPQFRFINSVIFPWELWNACKRQAKWERPATAAQPRFRGFGGMVLDEGTA